MAAEPIVIYSYKIDPAGVLRLLRQLAPDLRVDGPEDDWSAITITGPKRFLRKPWTLSFGHDLAYYSGEDWSAQLAGMQGFFGQFPENENTDRIILLIQSLRFALTTFPPPVPDLDLESDDPRLAFLFAVVKHLDGVIFTPSGLRDAAGRMLYGVEEPDVRAVMPGIYKEVPAAPRSERTRSQHGTRPEAGDPLPPTPQRVARRTLALAAVTARALLEQEDESDSGVEDTRSRLLAWIDEIGIGDELEPDEWKVLQRPLGTLPEQDTLNATWRLEGLGVLAWALQRNELPPHDEPVSPGQLLPSLAILDTDAARALLANPTLRPREELTAQRERLFAVHWRLNEWRLRPTAKDLVETAGAAWFGPLDLTGLRLIENDLAVGDQPLSRGSVDAVRNTTSAAVERHLTINWLCGGSPVYSETDVST